MPYALYWVLDNTCHSIEDGYVGVTGLKPVTRRLVALRHDKIVPVDAAMYVLASGTQEKLLVYEALLRPRPGMGWNKEAGGNAGGHQKFATLAKVILARHRGMSLSEVAAQLDAPIGRIKETIRRLLSSSQEVAIGRDWVF